jgi:hypothetical protein
VRLAANTVDTAQFILIAIRIINGHIDNGKTGSTIDRDCLYWRTENVKTRNRRGSGEIMSVEELRLGLAAIGSFSILPIAQPSIQAVAVVLANGDVLCRVDRSGPNHSS